MRCEVGSIPLTQRAQGAVVMVTVCLVMYLLCSVVTVSEPELHPELHLALKLLFLMKDVYDIIAEAVHVEMSDARNALAVQQLSVWLFHVYIYLLQTFWSSQRMHLVCLKAIRNPQINKVINLRKTPGRFSVGRSG